MTPSDARVHDWIASLVDRTAAQLRTELDVLVRQAQKAAPPREVINADANLDEATIDSNELSAAVAAVRIEGRQADLARAARVLDGVAALDSAGSLSDILDVLVDRAALHAGRVLLVVNQPDALTGWRWHGYTPDPRDASMLEIPADDPGLVARAARSGATETGSGPAAGQPGEGSNAENRNAIAVPLRVDGDVVAVLYADEDAADVDEVVPSPWTEVVEVLVRHAARCLESMTARRVPELVRRLAERPALSGKAT